MAHSWIIPFLELRIVLGCRRVDHRAYARDVVSRKAAQLCMGAHRGFVWRNIDAIDFVVGDETLKPRISGPMFCRTPQAFCEIACSSCFGHLPAPANSRSITNFGIIVSSCS